LVKIDNSTVTLADNSGGQTQKYPLADFAPGDKKLLELIAADE
jgi:hypothetical protein